MHKINISNAKVKASEKGVRLTPPMLTALIRFSHIPIIKAPITAPGIEPIPPKTAATKDLSPGMAPDVGMTEG